MTTRFHTPSFGDEVVFEEAEADSTVILDTEDSSQSVTYLQEQHVQENNEPSKRMRNMDDEYHSADQTAFAHGGAYSGASSLAHNPAAVAPAAKTTTTLAARKQLLPADPNELVRPISAYGLFFRDTVSVIKQQNPNCSFPELTRIVASMWEALDPSTKIRYQDKHEMARKEYEEQVRIQKQLAQQSLPTMATTIQSKPAVFTISPRCSISDSGEGSQLDTGEPPANSNDRQYVQSLHNQQQQYLYTSQPKVEVYERAAPQQEAQVQKPPPVAPPQPEEVSQESLDQFQQAYQLQQVLEASPPLSAQSPTTVNGAQPSIVPAAPPAVIVVTQNKCTRASCHKMAIVNTDWEDEYCSNECVIMHCRDVFAQWVQDEFGGRQA